MHSSLDVTPTPDPSPQGGGERAQAACDSISSENGDQLERLRNAAIDLCSGADPWQARGHKDRKATKGNAP
jgi:hypothetical protein